MIHPNPLEQSDFIFYFYTGVRPSQNSAVLIHVHSIDSLIDRLKQTKEGSLTAVIIDTEIFSHTTCSTDELFSELRRAIHQSGILRLVIGTPRQLRTRTFKELNYLIKASSLPLMDTDQVQTDSEQSITVRMNKLPHAHDPILSRKDFERRCIEFKKRHPERSSLSVSYIITVHNEARSLPHLLSFLDNISNETEMKREFVVVLNGCTDDSEGIVGHFMQGSELRISMVRCDELGILPAFKKGVLSRTQNGLVGRFDADIILHPYTLDLMQIHLLDQPEVAVTYAEPLTLDPPSPYNQPWRNPAILSRRLYYTGKTSLYRQNPFEDHFIANRPSDLITDDVLTSFYYVYKFGLNSISRTPNAVVYERVVNNFRDFSQQLSRISSELRRTLKTYPEFELLNLIMEQEVLSPGTYKSLLGRARNQVEYTDQWTRLESTK